jgi:hypothetical protein
LHFINFKEKIKDLIFTGKIKTNNEFEKKHFVQERKLESIQMQKFKIGLERINEIFELYVNCYQNPKEIASDKDHNILKLVHEFAINKNIDHLIRENDMNTLEVLREKIDTLRYQRKKKTSDRYEEDWYFLEQDLVPEKLYRNFTRIERTEGIILRNNRKRDVNLKRGKEMIELKEKEMSENQKMG